MMKFQRIIGLLALLVILAAFPGSAQSREDCLACHRDPDLSMEKKGKTISLAVNEATLNRSSHARLSCIACHTGFDPENIPHNDTIDAVNCLTCHAGSQRKHQFHPQMMKASGRDGARDVSCKGCHGTHDVIATGLPASPLHSSKLSQFCSTCHASVTHTFETSAHAKALKENLQGAPTCLTCHNAGPTKIHPERNVAEQRLAQEKMCLSCHLDDPTIRARTSASAGFIAAYEKSVHGAALLQGNEKAANCIDCHGSHEMNKGIDPASRVHRSNIPQTCGSCHRDVHKEFTESVHGQSAMRGVKDAPVCTDCHGEHNILSPDNPRSPVAPLNVSGQVCAPCHTSVRLTEKYGISSNRYETFSDSYHGLAVRAGSVEVANCASCHGVHLIKSSSDPTSSVHKNNLAATCGKCHPGANERFAVGTVHVAVAKQEEPVLYWIATLYIVMIVGIVGGMAVHNLADFVRKSRRKLLQRRGVVPTEPVSHRLYLRMTLDERLQHASLMISFTVLAITGFMLRYPEAWWVQAIRDLSDQVFDLRRLLHRVAAVVMIAASIYHLVYIFFTERGKSLIRDLMPRFQDVRDAFGVLKYNFGFSRVKPKFGRFSYIEKSEYWALVWGTIVMGLTGFVMWFDNTFIGLFTKVGYDIARIIHFYEAWLATLAIIVWHFYFVIFNPDVYPMNLAWLKGTLSEAEMHEEHPLELEAIKRQELAETMLDVPLKERKKETARANPKSDS